MDAEFVISAARPDQFPVETLPEIAFLGRSNVGKSSLLNCLTGKTGLAFTSKDITAQWKQLIEQYLLHRRSLELCFVILDARRGWMDKDLELRQWLEFHNRRYQVIATKTDKLRTQKEQRRQEAAIRSQSAFPGCEPLPFSAIQCRGVREIWQAIQKIKTQQQ